MFRVRAAGSFEPKAGCPIESREAMNPARLARLCQGECYYPSDRRRPITRIEIVRIRPQISPDEDVASLIDDPWRVFECDGAPEGCAKTFSDPDFGRLGRDTVYYMRAFEAEAPAINGGNLRCERDAEGNCLSVEPCPGPGGAADDCLAPHEPRAWSSPIFVDWPASRES